MIFKRVDVLTINNVDTPVALQASPFDSFLGMQYTELDATRDLGAVNNVLLFIYIIQCR
jgi:hypothetical protein